MSVDLEAIAQRGRCDVSSLRLAIPLLEQGYSPPFLARYRRDELGGLDESSLWALSSAIQTEQQVQRRRDELIEAWEQTSLCDPAIGSAIKKSNSVRMLNRLGRRLKHETGDAADDAARLAVRILNPQKGDDGDLSAVAANVDGIHDADAAITGVDHALATRLAGDPRMVAAAVRWLAKNARIQVASIHDPHLSADDEGTEDSSAQAHDGSDETSLEDSVNVEAVDSSTDVSAASDAAEPAEAVAAEPTSQTSGEEPETAVVDTPSAPVGDAGTEASEPAADNAGAPPSSDAANPLEAEAVAGADEAEAAAATESVVSPQEGKQPGKGKRKSKSNAAKQAGKKQKKISPRQRRRRWLVGVLKPLEGKRFASDKLSAFQIVMLGRAMRSQVAQCSFQYDATKLVAELQRTASSINRNFDPQLRQIVLDHEADIRESAEAAWWDDLHEKASSRLVTITADHLRRHVNRGAVEAKVVMAIDAIGPRTAATSIVCADGRILHNEDLPCQLSSTLRSQAVARMGELIHSYHVDLIVISNGPARRATMIALGDLITQSPDKSVHWTLADRSGADVYAGSSVADEEMRSTPRRFRAAAWLAFSVLQPAQSLAKIDPLKLRLSSFQRELSDDAMVGALEDVIISGASRGGVDVNSAPVSWLVRLPGVSSEVAQAIDQARRSELFSSRAAVSDLPEWSSVAASRQALSFLRVFGSDEVLDGTLIHPDDYALAKKLAAALEIELPPKAPPGYEPPNFSEPQDPTAKAKIAEAPSKNKPIVVEDFSNAGDRAKDFSVDDVATAEADAATDESATPMPDATADGTSNAVEAGAEGGDDAEASTASDDASAAIGDEAVEGEASPADQAADAEGATPAVNAISRDDIPEPIRHPRPERAKIDKCVKEWQIGGRRSHQLVQWLCDPFGDSDTSGSAPAVMTSIPSSKSLKEGDMVIGVVVGVMPFGVFVELAPDCSGLIHVSRVSDTYVEDLHEAVQVGDVVTAWVTGIDEKRRRVALTAISPEREAEIEEARRARDQRSHQAGPRRGGRDRAPAPRAGGTDAAPAARAAGGDARGGQARGGGQSRGGQARGGQSRGGPGRDSGPDSQGRGGRGGRGGKRQHDNRSGGRGREKKPESYRVVGKTEEKPITDAMQKGEEPLRSFGDLLQFFGKATSSKSPEPPKSKESSPPAEQQASTEDSGKPSPEVNAPAKETHVAEPTPSAGKDSSRSEANATDSAPEKPSSSVDTPAT